MEFRDIKFTEVNADDTFCFECSGCGKCCRNVEQAVMVENRDAFGITKHLRESGESELTIDGFFQKYCDAMPLDESRYPIFLLKTQGARNECVFLKNGRCGIYPVRPRACRMYPMSCGPDESAGELRYFIAHDQEHHFGGRKWKVRDWADENFPDEEREFIQFQYSSLGKTGKLLRKSSENKLERALFLILLYEYLCFDLDEPFLPQYKDNIRKLQGLLEALNGERSG